MPGTSPIEEIIDEAREGRPFILVDAEDRENEGDVIVPAQYATPGHINFMARHARGLICLAITRERAQQLRLQPMTPENESGHRTAFTVSIEARDGVSTGISAQDRAHTIAAAIDSGKGAQDIVSPGHVFPLVARDGGVLIRAGHTEAAVDIARLAGLNPAGVICEVMKDDGTMARLPDLVGFADTHGLKIGTIADLIAYRRRNERHVECVDEMDVVSRFGGAFRLLTYRNTLDGLEHPVLVRGRIEPSRPTMVRMHQVNFVADSLGLQTARTDYVARALANLAENDGPGVAVFIRSAEHSWWSERYRGDPHGARVANMRDYGVGAQILLDLGVRDIILLTSSTAKLTALGGYGLNILSRRAIA